MTEQRWLMAGFELVRRPIDTAPAVVPLCWVARDRHRFVVARRRGGEWDNGRGRPLKLEPTHWTIWAKDDPLAKAGTVDG